MKILHLSTSSTGGAGRAAFRMSAALRAHNQDSDLIYLGNPLNHNQVGVHPISRGPVRKVISSTLTYMQSRVVQSGTDPVTPISLNAIKVSEILDLKPDIVHIHNFYNLMSLPSIISLASRAKVVLTLHDQRIFTAGCHYSHGCLGYRSTCVACPQMNSLFQSGASRLFEKNMQDLRFDENSLTLVSPSEWLLSKARENLAFAKFSGYVVRNPIPEFKFPPNERGGDKKLRIGFCSDKLNNPLKGLAVLLNALAGLDRDYVLRLIGNELGDYKIPKGISFEIISPTSDAHLSSEIADLDVLVVPSLEDNSPNVIGEALMCGTKVIGSDIGGIGELMRQLQLDLFQTSKPNELAELLLGFDIDYPRSGVVDSARRTFSYEVVAPQIMEVYRGLL